MAQAATEQGAFSSSNLRLPTQPLTAEGRAAQVDMELQEAAEARESEEKAYDKETKGKYSKLFGSVDSSDDEIQQRKTRINSV